MVIEVGNNKSDIVITTPGYPVTFGIGFKTIQELDPLYSIKIIIIININLLV